MSSGEEDGSLFAVRYSLRPIVLPSLVWAFDASNSTTFMPGGPLEVASLGTRIGVPGIVGVHGLELGAVPAAFVLAPSAEAVSYVGSGSIALRLFPWLQKPVAASSPQVFEIGVRADASRDPETLEFLGVLQAPMALRAAPLLRIDLDPSIGFLGAAKQGYFATNLLVSLQPARFFWVGARSGVRIFDLSQTSTTAIPLGGEVGFTVPSPLGSLFDIVVDGTFPQLFQPADAAQTVDGHAFQLVATLRFFTYLTLCATNPVACSQGDDPVRVKRCGGQP